MDYKYDSIILEKINIGETDRFYVVYTKEAGKLRLLANGVRKPQAKLAGNLESVTRTEIFVAKNRGRGRITGAIAAENFLTIKGNITLLERVFEALKIFSGLVTQEEADAKNFDLILEYLRAMDSLGLPAKDRDVFFEEKADIFTCGFVFKLLKNLGYAQEMRKCVVCGSALRPGGNFFSAERGGTVCGSCGRSQRQKVKITDQSVKLIRLFQDNKMENLGKIRLNSGDLANLKLISAEAVRWIAG